MLQVRLLLLLLLNLVMAQRGRVGRLLGRGVGLGSLQRCWRLGALLLLLLEECPLGTHTRTQEMGRRRLQMDAVGLGLLLRLMLLLLLVATTEALRGGADASGRVLGG